MASKPKLVQSKINAKPKAKPAAAAAAANAEENGGDDPFHVFESLEHATEGGKKRLSIERIYQRKTQLEHVLLRPDTYIGSVEPVTQPMWVYDADAERMVQREITFVPGLYKIFDEIIVNAADNKQRDKKMTSIKIDINREKNEISVLNDGKGIPVVQHQVEKMYVPELIFGTLLTSSNYDDSQKKTTGGRNGYGAKLCNIFSKKFVVQTSCHEYKKQFKQTWRKNMGETDNAEVKPSDGADFTKITFQPDLAKFGMKELDRDIVDLMSRRAYDLAGSTEGIKVSLNGKRIQVSNFKDYVQLYAKNDNDEPLKIAYEKVNPRWEVALTVSDKGFQQVSFVNSIATTKGGAHVDYVSNQVVSKVIEQAKIKLKKSGMQIKPFQVKSHLWVFINCLIENPAFDSQTKENMTLQSKSFGSTCVLPEKFIQLGMKNGIMDSVMDWAMQKQQIDLSKKIHGSKSSKLKGMPKLKDANDAGTKNSLLCTLILTEGDSAKAQADSGLSVVGHDHYGIFPLKGKVLNVREASHKQIMENAEINNIIKILGLQYKKSYTSPEDMKTLRYGKVMIMCDQDQDGSHIKGLLINLFHHFWPHLIKQNFVEEFITPIVKVKKGQVEHSFFSLPEYEDWKRETENWHTWKIKYYKGLGTSVSAEMKEYFSDMRRHRIKFKHSGEQCDQAIVLAFSKEQIENRKVWLTDFMNEKKRRRDMGLGDIYLYERDTTAVTYKEFINKELVLFSNMDNERSIPSLLDGLKPGQRKVMFTCFKRNDKREVKVAQLAGSVAEMSSYHHGEVSLMGTIINMAQNFVGSNNINLLLPLGMFGTRESGGKNAASARYIFTMLNPVTRALFKAEDEPCLNHLFDDNQKIEPEWYVPIIPTVLVNGTEGIGTAYSTKIPNFNPREIVDNIKRMLDGEDPLPMKPWYKGFRGTIEPLGGGANNQRYICFGVISKLDHNSVEITELPIKTWTQPFKESLDVMLNGTEKTQPIIQDYREYSTDTTVRFVVKMSDEQMEKAEAAGLHNFFKLHANINLSSMVLFDSKGVLRKFERIEEILQEFYTVRLEHYQKRKDYLEGLLVAQASKLSNQARFILAKIDGKIKLENIKKKDIIDQLIKLKFDPDPVKKWQDAQKKEQEAEPAPEDSADESEEKLTDVEKRLSDYDYLVKMALIRLSEEEVKKLLKERDDKQSELEVLQKKTPKDLWLDDLDKFLVELDKQEQKEIEEEKNYGKKAAAKSAAGKGAKGAVPAAKRVNAAECMPSPHAKLVMPIIDASMKLKMEKADIMKENKGKGGAAGGGRGKKGKAEKAENASDDEGAPVGLLDRVLKRKSLEEGKPLPQQKDIKNFFHPVARSKETKSPADGSDADLFPDDSNSTTPPAKPTAAAAKKRPAKAAGAGPSRPRKAVGGGSPAKKKSPPKKKKEPWESDSEDEKPGRKRKVSLSSDEDEESFAADRNDSSKASNRSDDYFASNGDIPLARDLPKRARKEVKYNVDDVDEDDSFINDKSDSAAESDEDVKPAKTKKTKKGSDDSGSDAAINLSDSDDDDDDDFKAKLPSKPLVKRTEAAKASAKPKTKQLYNHNFDEDLFDQEEDDSANAKVNGHVELTGAKSSATTSAAAAGTSKKTTDSGDDDSDFEIIEEKTAKPKPAAASKPQAAKTAGPKKPRAKPAASKSKASPAKKSAAAPRKKKQTEWVASDSEDDKPSRKPKARRIDSDDESEASRPSSSAEFAGGSKLDVATRELPQRARKPVSYKFDSDESVEEVSD